jgi:protein-disulfide isomerase
MEKEDFIRCFNDPGVRKEVQNDMAEAAKYGVKGTPVFFINGRMVMGALPFEKFKEIIDEELSKKKP